MLMLLLYVCVPSFSLILICIQVNNYATNARVFEVFLTKWYTPYHTWCYIFYVYVCMFTSSLNLLKILFMHSILYALHNVRKKNQCKWQIAIMVLNLNCFFFWLVVFTLSHSFHSFAFIPIHSFQLNFFRDNTLIH